MNGVEISNISPFPEGLRVEPAKNDLENFVIQVRGDLQFAKIHAGLYSKIIATRTKKVRI